jgi:uncharacterized protein (TIGR02284 family)
MAVDTKEIHSTLNTLIETCKDGENGFRTAAESVKSSSLRTMFQGFSAQRAKFAAELQVEVSRLGGTPEKSGSVSGAAHRGWMNIKAAVTGDDDRALINEAERGEDVAVKAYRDALAKDVPNDVRNLIERQYRDVQEAHNQVRALQVHSSGAA